MSSAELALNLPAALQESLLLALVILSLFFLTNPFPHSALRLDPRLPLHIDLYLRVLVGFVKVLVLGLQIASELGV